PLGGIKRGELSLCARRGIEQIRERYCHRLAGNRIGWLEGDDKRHDAVHLWRHDVRQPIHRHIDGDQGKRAWRTYSPRRGILGMRRERCPGINGHRKMRNRLEGKRLILWCVLLHTDKFLVVDAWQMDQHW